MTTEQFVAFVRQQGEWLTAGEPAEDVAADWLKLNVDRDSIAQYINAGVFDRDACERLAWAGIAPAGLERSVEVCGTRMTVGYAYANNDVSLDDVRQHLAQA
jgi:hypothetical protein